MEVEVLKLGEGEERWCRDDIDFVDVFETVIIQKRRVLKCQPLVAVRKHSASVIDDVDV